MLEWTNRCRLLKFHAGKFLRLLIDTRGKAKIHFGCLPHPFFRQLHCHFVYFPLNQISGCLPHPRSTQETNKGDKMAKLKIIDLKKKFQNMQQWSMKKWKLSSVRFALMQQLPLFLCGVILLGHMRKRRRLHVNFASMQQPHYGI